ncbi:hypothetical protein ASPVEDRAFT_144712 [Aspergillus versicolor CBS 583.65]|uniref:J domain-containing protein n=1 Tax=Aspergillus versicolor CBS 583.65 TaxID=1036611 RepID=A0A1L9Q4S8_ASPVE|nr:uncharacterized protein ASPVEDRAFT_144712 [Aspergillus versicolor CBS 583.65]OJJ08731.1 hypothetical protein ASPVEDRAFT_144712 [Aspergillus versicolor CBS 583.65]
MGQGHSTAQAGTGDSNEKSATKKDYYELLEVDQNASSEESALELHPDRNFGNVHASTNLFAEIQSAYEVLSDPQERSWYDSHRDAFLGGDGKGNMTENSHKTHVMMAADILKLFSKFSPRMEFTDALDGFYGGLRETFAQIALEEESACRWENLDIIKYPSFGSRDDAFASVRGFYAAWGSFSTKKSFSWKDAYRYSDAPDRRVRRLMEKENRRLREGAIREFNEAVRSLVAFAKKRDPRYKSYRDSSSQHREALFQSAASQATRSRAANQARLRSHVLQDWAKSEEPEEDVAESFNEDETEQFECIVCCKIFKSQNQFLAHERSKKHIKAVKQLRWEMKIQNDELNLGDAANDNGDTKTTGDGSYQGEDSVNISTSPPGRSLDCSNDKTEHSHPEISNHDADYAPREVLERRLDQENPSTQILMDNVDNISQGLSAARLNETSSSTTAKVGKAKQKRAKKARLAEEKIQLTECTICNASFSSRNKLFSHLKLHR